VPLREAFEQVAALAAELSAKLARTIVKAMRNVLEIMVLSSSLFFACVHLSFVPTGRLIEDFEIEIFQQLTDTRLTRPL
jgi:hypothetical protein